MAKGPTIEVKFTGDTKGLSNATGRVDRELEGVGKKVSGFAIGAGAAVTSMAVSSIPQLVNFGKELFALGQSSEVGAKKTATVFGDSAADVNEWADRVNESLGLSDEAVGTLATSMGDLLVPMGFSRAEAAELSMTTTEAAGALSAWSEGQYDASEVSAILTKAMLGERDGLKALGISMSQAEVDERALAVAKAEGRDEITAQDKAIATQALIIEKSADAQTAWTDGTMDAVKQQNELSASIADAKEGLAKGLVPIVQKTIRFIVNDLIPAVKRAVETFRKNWPQIRAAVEPTMIQIRDIIKSVVELATTLWETFGDDILRIAKFAFDSARKTVEIAMRAIQGVIDVIMGILTGDWSRALEGLLGIFSAVWDAIKFALSNALKIITGLLSLALDYIWNYWKAVWTRLKSFFSGIWDGMSTYVREKWNAIVGFVSSGINSMMTFITAIPGRISRGVAGAFDSLKNAFRNALNWIIDKWNGIGFTLPTFKFDVPLDGRGPYTFGGQTFNTPNIRRLANGAMITSPTLALVGEAGPELVLPMNRPQRAAQLLAQALQGAVGGDGLLPASTRRSNSPAMTVIQNYPQGVTPTRVTQLSRQYDRTQGPL